MKQSRFLLVTGFAGFALCTVLLQCSGTDSNSSSRSDQNTNGCTPGSGMCGGCGTDCMATCLCQVGSNQSSCSGACQNCGNGKIDANEDCDGNLGLNNTSCDKLTNGAMPMGNPSCSNACKFDKGNCRGGGGAGGAGGAGGGGVGGGGGMMIGGGGMTM